MDLRESFPKTFHDQDGVCGKLSCTIVQTMDLVYKLQELSSCIQSLIFELEENSAPTRTMCSIMERMAMISTITMDLDTGKLSHFNNFSQK